MKHGVFFALSFAIGTLSLGCGQSGPYTPSYTASTPMATRQGVYLALAGQRCYVNRTAEQFPTQVGDDRLHLDLKLDVANGSSRPVSLAFDRFRLADQGRIAAPPVQSGTVVMQPGDRRSLNLAFETRARPDCRQSLALAPNGALTIDGTPVGLESIRFRPHR